MPYAIPKSSFAGGEFSPRLWRRIELEKHATGARKLYNILVDIEGSASNRPGTYYMGSGKVEDKLVKLFPFQFSTSQRYSIEAGDEYFRFYTNEGQIATGAVAAWADSTAYVVGDMRSYSGASYYCYTAHTSVLADNRPGTGTDWEDFWHLLTDDIYEIPSPYQDTQLFAISYAQSNDVLFMTHDAVRPKLLTRFGATNWQVSNYVNLEGPFMIQNTDAAKIITPSAVTGSITLTASGAGFAPFNAQHVGALWQFRHYIPGQAVTSTLASATNGASIKCGGTWRLITHGTWTGKAQVEKSTDGGTTWTSLRAFSSVNDNNINTFGTDDNDGDPYLVRLNMTTYTSGTLEYDLTTDAFFQIGVVEITGYTSGTVVAGLVKKELGLAAACVDWSEGSWSDYRGWPRQVTFEQQSVVFAGTRTEPTGIWKTETGNFYSFAKHSPLLDTDSISLTLPSLERNEINGLVSLLGLVPLTTGGEWTIAPVDGALTPTTVNPKINSYYGSSGVRPVIVGNRAVYVRASGDVIQDLGYDLYSNGFSGAAISVISRHLFERKTIVQLAYQQDPNSVVWGVRDDGRLVMMTYLREQEMLAWTWGETGDGEDFFEDVITIQGTGFKEVWFVVNRDGVRFIERMVERMASTAPEDQFYVDCGITYDDIATTVITGLDHLEGREVAVLADGNVVANWDSPYTVTGGQITLPQAASKVHVGIPYYSDIETLNLEVPTRGGTSQGKKAKIGAVTLDFVESRGGQIGPSFDLLHEIAETQNPSYGDALALYTGDVYDSLAGGYEKGARVCVRQTDPLPMTIATIIPEITVGGSSAL